MSIGREDIAFYLDTQFNALVTLISDDDDLLLGYSADVDNVFRRMGVSELGLESAELDDSKRDAAFALGEFYCARRVLRRLGNRVKHTMGETSYDPTEQLKMVKVLMDEAASNCARLGYVVAGTFSKRPIFEVH